MSAPAQKKPWPMKWVVLAIVVSLAGYTFVTLKYRKLNRPSQPVEDARERFVVSRLRQAGYSRIPVNAELPGDPAGSLAGLTKPFAAITDSPGGLPTELAETFAEKPRLPDSFGDVSAPASHTAMLPYFVQYICQLPDNQKVFGDTRVYAKENQIAIVTDFDRLDADLLARSKETTVRLPLPAGIFRSGQSYEITLVGQNASKRWTLHVH